ncbi:hypothetical protein VTL71DRAFT_10141 [Oculimacula yallundae]|uniref:Gustatory receptor n=1 Tax=Oculimacula yallundae TaxID=86028 RepID=A0ABR4BPN9_9HELO
MVLPLVCGTVNCTFTDGTIEGNPDIAGIGVLIAFISASSVTFIAIVLGYITYSIDPAQLNYVDSLVIPHIRWLLWMGTGDTISTETKKLRVQAMTHFILALSDQQLVTGLAILITGYAQRCSISGHHFKLIANLAWFSSTTHLSTLTVLQRYLIRHPLIKHIRVIGILAVLRLLLHAQFYVQGPVGDSEPIQCTFEFRTAFPTILNSRTLLRAMNTYLSWLIVILFLFVAYTSRIIQLYSKAHITSIGTLIEDLIRRGLDLPKIKTSEETFLRTLKRIRRTKYTRKHLSCSGKLFIALARSRYVLSMFMDSFWWQITRMLFGNVFGLLQLSKTRFGYHKMTESAEEDHWGFGQLVAILLMILPFLVAAEAYSELQAVIALGASSSGAPRNSQISHSSNETVLHLSSTQTDLMPSLEHQEPLNTESHIQIGVIWVAGSFIWVYLAVFLSCVGWLSIVDFYNVIVICIFSTVGIVFLIMTYSGGLIRDIAEKLAKRRRRKRVPAIEEVQLAGRD